MALCLLGFRGISYEWSFFWFPQMLLVLSSWNCKLFSFASIDVEGFRVSFSKYPGNIMSTLTSIVYLFAKALACFRYGWAKCCASETVRLSLRCHLENCFILICRSATWSSSSGILSEWIQCSFYDSTWTKTANLLVVMRSYLFTYLELIYLFAYPHST